MERKDLTDLTGERFGYLVVVSLARVHPRTGGTTWICKCDCGKGRYIPASALKNGKAKSCGCMAHKRMHDPEGIAVAKLIKPFRDNYKMSQRAAAILVGCSTNTISLWEYGTEVPNSYMTRKLRNLVEEGKQMSQEEIRLQSESEPSVESTTNLSFLDDILGRVRKTIADQKGELDLQYEEIKVLKDEIASLHGENNRLLQAEKANDPSCIRAPLTDKIAKLNKELDGYKGKLKTISDAWGIMRNELNSRT